VKPKVAFVVQRCGKEVNGGAELSCFFTARCMKEVWDVEILTTCAIDYITWNNYYTEGVQVVEDVPIRRFKVDQPRDIQKFNAYCQAIAPDVKNVSLARGETWMKLQGPMSSRLMEYLDFHRNDYDAFIFFTYLYATTYYGLPIVQDKAHLVPTAHDEWPIYLPIWDVLFSRPQTFIFNTVEERAFIQKRFPKTTQHGEVIGVGVQIPKHFSKDDFIVRFHINDPYILYIGRIDESKGCRQLIDYFLRYKEEYPSNIKLVLAGKAVMPIPTHQDIIPVGFIDDQAKFDALAGCKFLINPSPYESLSMVLLEAWSLNIPVLVNGAAEVMVGQCKRSNSGLWYENYDEFHACVEYLFEHPDLARRGSVFVQDNYSWPTIREKYRRLLSL
jgi:glycosyltransferase involved in cell wall biosynthesis